MHPWGRPRPAGAAVPRAWPGWSRRPPHAARFEPSLVLLLPPATWPSSPDLPTDITNDRTIIHELGECANRAADVFQEQSEDPPCAVPVVDGPLALDNPQIRLISAWR